MYEVDSRLCGNVRFKYHDDLPEIDPLERIGLIVAEDKAGNIIKCERDRDLELQRCNEFIKRGALVQRRGAFGFVADGDAADRFLAQVIPNLQGWEIRGQDRLHRGRPPTDITTSARVMAHDDYLELEIDATVDGRTVPIKELLKNAARGQNVMVFKDGLRARINDEWLNRYRTLSRVRRPEGSERQGARTAPRRRHGRVARRVGRAHGARRHHQGPRLARQGRRRHPGGRAARRASTPRCASTSTPASTGWCFLSNRGLGGVLADDMGLGKTVQSLTFAAAPPPEDPGVHLVVAPTRVVDNWVDECKKFVPDMPVHTHLGLDRVKSLEKLPKTGRRCSPATTSCSATSSCSADRVLDGRCSTRRRSIRTPKPRRTRAGAEVGAKRRVALVGHAGARTGSRSCGAICTSRTPACSAAARRFQEIATADRSRGRDRDGACASRVAPFVLRRMKSEVAHRAAAAHRRSVHASRVRGAERVSYDRESAQTGARRACSRLASAASRLEALLRAAPGGVSRGLVPAACAPARSAPRSSTRPRSSCFLRALEEAVADGHRRSCSRSGPSSSTLDRAARSGARGSVPAPRRPTPRPRGEWSTAFQDDGAR